MITKEELLKIIETMEMEEIVEVQIIYYKEKNYTMYDKRTKQTLELKGE